MALVIELGAIFADVLIPVFLLVLLGYIVGPRLQLHTQTLSRFGYLVLTPAFVFVILSEATVKAEMAIRMTLYIMLVQIGCAILGFIIAKLLRRPPQMVAAYVLVCVFGNVGNFGLPIITFVLGERGMAAATVYFLAVMVIALLIGETAANWNRGVSLKAFVEALKTPSLIVLPVAILFNWLNIDLPHVLARPITMLADAVIPTMLLVLGMQLAHTNIPKISGDMIIASSVRLIASPILAIVLALPFGLTGIERNAGILQASMPVAVLTSIIAMERDLLPDFVTATILFSTLASMVTLTVVVGIMQVMP